MAVNGPANRAAGLGGRRILIVEDEYFIADDLSRGLHRQDAQVVGPVSDLATGLDLARREQLDGAVLDVNLDGEMSYPIADELSRRGVPFVFTTGYDGTTLAPAYCSITRIEKPCDVSAIMSALTELMDNSAVPETKS